MKRSMTRWALAGCMGLAALSATAMFDVAPATADAAASSTVSDPVGDADHKAPAFQDIVRGRMTKTPSGDFELLMELAGPVPVSPPLPRPGVSEIWWMWFFDDPATSPKGYPASPGFDGGREFVVYVSWDGAAFSGTAVDRRPLLSGGEAIITPVRFSIDGAVVEAVLPSELISGFPASFVWGPRTIGWSAPLGSAGFHPIDDVESVFNP